MSVSAIILAECMLEKEPANINQLLLLLGGHAAHGAGHDGNVTIILWRL